MLMATLVIIFGLTFYSVAVSDYTPISDYSTTTVVKVSPYFIAVH